MFEKHKNKHNRQKIWEMRMLKSITGKFWSIIDLDTSLLVQWSCKNCSLYDKSTKFGTKVVLVILDDFQWVATTKNSKGVVRKALIVNLLINYS